MILELNVNLKNIYSLLNYSEKKSKVQITTFFGV